MKVTTWYLHALSYQVMWAGCCRWKLRDKCLLEWEGSQAKSVYAKQKVVHVHVYVSFPMCASFVYAALTLVLAHKYHWVMHNVRSIVTTHFSNINGIFVTCVLSCNLDGSSRCRPWCICCLNLTLYADAADHKLCLHGLLPKGHACLFIDQAGLQKQSNCLGMDALRPHANYVIQRCIASCCAFNKSSLTLRDLWLYEPVVTQHNHSV